MFNCIRRKPKVVPSVEKMMADIRQMLISQQAIQRFDGSLKVAPNKVFIGPEQWPRIKANLEKMSKTRPD